jgi:hypothetical protein
MQSTRRNITLAQRRYTDWTTSEQVRGHGQRVVQVGSKDAKRKSQPLGKGLPSVRVIAPAQRRQIGRARISGTRLGRGWLGMNSSSSTTVSAELGLRLVVPQQTIVPLVASLYYSGNDPYAIRMAFHVGTDEPVEWIFARDLLAAGIDSRQGEGDVQVWPSEPADSEEGSSDDIVLNIELSSPFGQAHFEAPAEAMSAFLKRTYSIVPAGKESGFVDIESELNELLRQA